MRASAGVIAQAPATPGAAPRLVGLRSAAPLSLRWAGGCLYVVGSAFAPLGGDDLTLSLVVEAGATLVVRTVAASVALPAPSGLPSRMTVEARVERGGTLHWLPEAAVAAQGARHQARTRLDLAEGATVVWREEVVLGRHGEAGGEWQASWRVRVAGRPVLVQDTVIGGPDWSSPAVGGGARAAGSLLAIGATDLYGGWATTAAGTHAAVLPLPHPHARLVSALAPDSLALRRALTPTAQNV